MTNVEPALNREQLQADIVTVLWAQAHVLVRVFGRDHHRIDELPRRGATAFDMMADRPIDRVIDLEAKASDFGVGWGDVAHTSFAETMQDLYDFAYFATFDPLCYPHELGQETSAWWISMYLREFASSQSLLWQSEYSGLSEVQAAKRLLQTVEIANARNLLEGAGETFLDESEPGFLSIRELSLVSGFKEESLRALANPKRKNPLPTQTHKGTTVVSVEDARLWLKAKGRYQAISPRPNTQGLLNLASAKFDSLEEICHALYEHVRALGTQGEKAQATLQYLKSKFPETFWQSGGVDKKMGFVGLDLAPVDLKDEPRMRELASILGFNPDLLMLRVNEADLRARLAAIESRIKSTHAQTPNR